MRYTATICWTTGGTFDVATEANSESEAETKIENGEFEMTCIRGDLPGHYEITDIVDLTEDPSAVRNARRAAAARRRRKERAVQRARLKPMLEEQCGLARSRVMRMAEDGHIQPIPFDVRVVSGSILIEKRFSLSSVMIVRDCFTDEPIAESPIIVVREDFCPPVFVQEWIEPVN